VPTIANHALLVGYAWPENLQKYRKLTPFVNEFLSNVDQFRDGSRHPSNLQRSGSDASVGVPNKVGVEFQKALATYQNARGNKPLTSEEKDLIINQLKLMMDKRTQ
jgi:hypothetical protein